VRERLAVRRLRRPAHLVLDALLALGPVGDDVRLPQRLDVAARGRSLELARRVEAVAARESAALHVREPDGEGLSVEQRDDPVDGSREGIALEGVPAHRLLERDAADDALEDAGKRLRGGLPADLLQGHDALGLDAEI